MRFAHREPAQLQPFRMFFRTTLSFDAEDYSMRFAAGWLQRPVAQADPALRRVLQKEIDAIEARHEADFPEQVRSVLRTALLTGHARSDQLAALFSMHSSTLARRLKPYGVGFRELVDECRYEVAREMLAQFRAGREPHRRDARLRRRQRLHARLQALERHHAGALAGAASGLASNQPPPLLALKAGHEPGGPV